MSMLLRRRLLTGGSPTYETVEGAIASFSTRRAAPLTQLLVDINPVQAGSGDPSPDNVRVISGWDSVQIHRTGANLLSGDDLLTVLAQRHTFTPSENQYGRYISFAAANASSYFRIPRSSMKFKENTRYTIFSKDTRGTSPGSQNLKIFYTDGSNEYLWNASNIENADHRKVSAANKTISYIGGANSGGITYLYVDYFGIFEGVVSLDDYVAYQGTIVPITFPDPPGTVYGGTLDVLSGVLTVDKIYVEFDGTEDWIRDDGGYMRMRFSTSTHYVVNDAAICSHLPENPNISSGNAQTGFRVYNKTAGQPQGATYLLRFDKTQTKDDFLAYLAAQAAANTPVQIVYTLATPQTYQLDPVTLSALKGQNHLWADCGDVTVTFRSN